MQLGSSKPVEKNKRLPWWQDFSKPEFLTLDPVGVLQTMGRGNTAVATRTVIDDHAFTTRRATLAEWRSRAGARDFRKPTIGGESGAVYAVAASKHRCFVCFCIHLDFFARNSTFACIVGGDDDC